MDDLRNLAEQAAAGDRGAFARLAECLKSKLSAVAGYYLRERADVEDALQAVWEKVWSHRGQLAGRENPAAWLAAVVRHHCLDQLRGRKRQAERTAQLPLAEYVNFLTALAPDPESLALEREARRTLLRYVRGLPELYGVPLKLFYYNGFKQAEIAGLLGLPETTVKWRLHVGRLLVKREIVKEGWIG